MPQAELGCGASGSTVFTFTPSLTVATVAAGSRPLQWRRCPKPHAHSFFRPVVTLNAMPLDPEQLQEAAKRHLWMHFTRMGPTRSKMCQ